MMFSYFLVIFISISQARTDSLLTGTYVPNSTALINERRDIKEIDVLRQIINQETLIRLAVVKDVKAVVGDVMSVRRSMMSTETMVSTLQQNLETLKRRVDSLIQNNALQLKVEALQRQVDSLSQVIQKRRGGSVSFNKTWAEYKEGFGNPSGTHWIGNDVIHQLTKGNKSSLYVSITLRNGTTLYELYHQFSVSDESDKYRLFLGGPATGTLGDSMLNTGRSDTDLSGMYFSTPDRDNDRASRDNCAGSHRGDWWFNSCYRAYLNGPWSERYWYNPWYLTVLNGRDVKETVMMIKPKGLCYMMIKPEGLCYMMVKPEGLYYMMIKPN